MNQRVLIAFVLLLVPVAGAQVYTIAVWDRCLRLLLTFGVKSSVISMDRLLSGRNSQAERAWVN